MIYDQSNLIPGSCRWYSSSDLGDRCISNRQLDMDVSEWCSCDRAWAGGFVTHLKDSMNGKEELSGRLQQKLGQTTEDLRNLIAKL
jgi:hypothetical protein